MNFIKFSINPLLLSASTLYSLSLILLLTAIHFFSSNKIIILDWLIISLHSCNLSIPLIIDPAGLLFRATVCFISANVIIFSKSYINQEKFQSRFIHLVILFIISINLLIFIPNLITLLLG